MLGMKIVLLIGLLCILFDLLKDLICTEKTEGFTKENGIIYDSESTTTHNFFYYYIVNGKKYRINYSTTSLLYSCFFNLNKHVIVKYNKEHPSISKIQGNYECKLFGIISIIVYIIYIIKIQGFLS